ncbi:type IV secretory system conjugative DNA transfer family protein [Streptomyces coacervatus]|uniref:type IV secretory system conjugative DNA transfer family protein n=1 Tax=Streptomyces coacervatus TaxID=647381 RepID=UPI0023DBAC5D|nr:type IV secretory system conjugative DNA transfer family protein [Streptomyces coacervatus]MDF2271296.1 type IV secretory system conjugative DNA transfer family protein [Streptomyces coacervatus]
MRPDDRRRDAREAQGGIPDGLLLAILAFLLGMTLLVWSATGLAGWFAKGSWPDGVTFTRTPLAMRHLIGQPHDIPGAWPATPGTQLSGYGLFWGLFIGQLMVLFVLMVFVMGTFARWRAGRLKRRTEGPTALDRPTPEPPPTHYDVPAPHEVPTPRTAPPEPQPTELHQEAAPAPSTPLFADERTTVGGVGGARETLVVAPRESRQVTATQAVRDAEGPALVITSNPAVWSDTKDARAKLGPVLLYDPAHLCDTPARLHWSPTTGCEDKQTAAARAAALLAPIRPTAKLDQALSATAETLLRSYVHAAAVDGRTIRHVHRWSQGSQVQDAVRILRTNPKAAPGSAGELEAALTAHPERRDMAQELTSRALSALFTVNIREACTPNRTDALALDSFVHEGGTLYVVGESIEDPRTNPGAMPLLTALVSSVVECGRRMAERSSSGRLDPPLTLVLDDVAAVAPLPQLPELLATGADRGLPTLALLRSREQGRARWPHDELPV